MQEQAATPAAARGETGTMHGLMARLQGLGFDMPVNSGQGGATRAVAEHISVRSVLRDDLLAERFLSRLVTFCRREVPVCLSVREFGSDAGAYIAWKDFCELIRCACKASGASVTQVGFCMHSHQLPVRAWCEVADAMLGDGPRYVFLDSLQMQSHCNKRVEARTQANWTSLWQGRRAERPVVPVYGGFVRSACPLLADEAATTVLPDSGLCVPASSAWLPVALNLGTFADGTGALDSERLADALHEAVRIADRLVDLQRWATPAQRADAEQNRRLAFVVSGIGDLVERRGDSPVDLRCLRELAGVLGRIRRALIRASSRLAREAGEVPALAAACPAGDWFNGSHREVWRRRFDAARRKSAVRHRNLLVVSPYAVLPTESRAATAFTDLLPVIRCADAWCFAGPPSFERWNVMQFKHFHRRARAVIQASHVTSRVAAGA